MTLYHNQQRIMVEGMVEGHLRIIRGHHRSNGSLVGQIVSFKHWMMQLEFLTLRVVRRNKIRLQILINPDPAQKDFLDFHFFIQFHSKIFNILQKFQSLQNFYNIWNIWNHYVSQRKKWCPWKTISLRNWNSFSWFFKINK